MSNEISWWELYKSQFIVILFSSLLSFVLGSLLAPITLRKYDEWRKEVKRNHEEKVKSKEKYLKNLNSLKKGIDTLISYLRNDDYQDFYIENCLPVSILKTVSKNSSEKTQFLKCDYIDIFDWFKVCKYIIYNEIKNIFEEITPNFYKNSKHHITNFSDKFYKSYLNGIKVTKQLFEETELKFYEDYFKKSLELSEEINNLPFLINTLNEVFMINKNLIKYRENKQKFEKLSDLIKSEILKEISELEKE